MARSFLVLVAAFLTLPVGAAAAEPDWAGATRVDVALSSFKFAPQTLRLRAGQPVVLHLVNTGSGGHDFTSPEFFAAADVRGSDAGKIRKGEIDLRGHQSVDIALRPKAGRYKLRCGHAFHSTLGMKGAIVVQ
jgi:plastocyanin